MSFIISYDENEGGDFEREIPDEGMYLGCCVRIIDMGLQYNQAYNKYNKTVKIQWELIGTSMKNGKYAGMPFFIGPLYGYTQSLSPKSTLRPIIESWRGKKLTAEEAHSFDLSACVGKYADIQVIHSPNKSDPNKIHANIGAIIPTRTPPDQRPAPVSPLICYKIGMDDPGNKMWDLIPESVRKYINLTGDTSQLVTPQQPVISHPAPNQQLVQEPFPVGQGASLNTAPSAYPGAQPPSMSPSVPPEQPVQFDTMEDIPY